MSTDTTVTSKQSSFEEEIENNTTMAADVVDRSESPIGKTHIRIPGKGKFSHAAKNSNSDNAPPTRQDIALTKVMLAIFIGFTFCFGPYFFVNVFDGETSRYPVFVYKMVAWMLYLQSCLNPIIYGFMNKQFRDDTRSMFRCGWNHGQAIIRRWRRVVHRTPVVTLRWNQSNPAISPSLPSAWIRAENSGKLHSFLVEVMFYTSLSFCFSGLR